MTDNKSENADALIAEAARLIAPGAGEAVFYIRVGGEQAHMQIKAAKGVEPARALSEAIATLRAEQADLDTCPVHTPPAPNDDLREAGEVEWLTHVIDRDRYVAAACVNAIEHVLHTRRWLREAGRGSYAYDDERYQEEFGLAFDEIQEALRPMRALSKDKTDCTRDEDKVKAARAAGAKKFAALKENRRG